MTKEFLTGTFFCKLTLNECIILYISSCKEIDCSTWKTLQETFSIILKL